MASRAYGQGLIQERHRHRYEVNNDYLRRSSRSTGCAISGIWAEKQLVEIIELPDHPWFVAGQFHPEFRSRPWEPHPLFAGVHQGGAGSPGRGRRVTATRPVASIGRASPSAAARPLALIGGPCAIENEKHALMMAERLQRITADGRVPFIYKSSYDKANRSSVAAYRGPGLGEGLRILRKVKDETGLPVLSDVHDVSEVAPAAEVLDVLQVPAFLCRQTDLSSPARGAAGR